MSSATSTSRRQRCPWWLLVVMVAVFGCQDDKKKSEESDKSGAAARRAKKKKKKRSRQLPKPYIKLRLGMTRDKVMAAYPPREDVEQCAPRLAGDPPTPALPPPVDVLDGGAGPGGDSQPHASCATPLQIAGFTDAEARKISSVATGGKRSQAAAQSMAVSVRHIFAQLRGSARAGTLSDQALLAASGTSEAIDGAVLEVAGKFYDGAKVFVRPRKARRPICAVIASDCSGLDRERIRTYISGGWSLEEIEDAARSRVADGICRGPYVRKEKDFKRAFIENTGAFAGIGLARAANEDHKLDPADPESYEVYSSRCKLDAETAKLGVVMANALPETEAFWRGAVVLTPSEDQRRREPWGKAIVWFEDGKLSRVLVNVLDDTKRGELVSDLSKTYGKPSKSEGTVTQWALLKGGTATLDLGGALALVLTADESEATPAAREEP